MTFNPQLLQEELKEIKELLALQLIALTKLINQSENTKEQFYYIDRSLSNLENHKTVSIREIAKHLGTTIEAARKRISRFNNDPDSSFNIRKVDRNLYDRSDINKWCDFRSDNQRTKRAMSEIDRIVTKIKNKTQNNPH